MAFTGIMTTEAEIDQKTGAGVSSDFDDVMKTAKCLQAESKVNIIGRYNFSDTYATLNVDVKYFLSDLVSSMVAIEGIKYDMGGYTNQTEAAHMINVLDEDVKFGLSLLRNKEIQRFMNNA